MEQGFNFNIYNVTEVDRVTFIKRTYAHVALAILAFVGFEALLLNSEIGIELGISMANNWIIVILLFMGGTWIANKWAQEPGNIQKQYIGLFLYAFLEALIFLPLFMIVLYSEQFQGEATQIIGQAGVVSAGLFTALSGIAIFSGKDFSFLRSILMVGFGVAFAMIIAGSLFGFDLGLWFSAAMVLLAGGSILFQTSRLVHDYHSTQHVAAALGLFASFMLLFYYVLQIFMSRD
ncbi:MAG: Bax inhibitor-1 family protein [Flavobacteriales bacterium]|nr:Bax inhibitor-1 family protein [Flavobacteriales bacterium]